MFEYDSLPRSRSRAEWTIAPWSNAVGEGVDRVPARVGRHGRVDAERDETEVGGRDLPFDRVPTRVAVGRHLLQVRNLGEVDLHREMPADRCLEGLVRRQHAARKGPRTRERLERPLPQQCLQHAVPHLQHCGHGYLGRSCRFGRLRPRFTTHSQKLAKGSDDDKGPDKSMAAGDGNGARRRARGGCRAPRCGLWQQQRRGQHHREHARDGHDGREGDQGRADHRPRPAQRQRVQRGRLQRAQAGRARARGQGPRRRVGVRRRLRPEHVDAREAGLRPDHRRRLRAG